MASPRLCSFPKSISVTSACGANLKCAPQVEALVQENRPFSMKDQRCVLAWCLWSALGGKIVSSIISDLWGPETQSSLATRARQSRASPMWAVHTCWLCQSQWAVCGWGAQQFCSGRAAQVVQGLGVPSSASGLEGQCKNVACQCLHP